MYGKVVNRVQRVLYAPWPVFLTGNILCYQVTYQDMFVITKKLTLGLYCELNSRLYSDFTHFSINGLLLL